MSTSLEIQNAYAEGRLSRREALAALTRQLGREDVAAEIIGQIDGDSDVVRID